MLDIIGIGAINVDFIATRQNLQRLDPQLQAELDERFKRGDEREIGIDALKAGLHKIGSAHFDPNLGGSALNVIQAVAALHCGLKLGYVGVCGDVEAHGVSFKEWSTHNQVDVRWVRYENAEPGMCLSYIADGERSLHTTPGVNSLMSAFIEDNLDHLVVYLSNAKLIHVTSFLDTNTSRSLTRLLVGAKMKNPCLRISFDPGYIWVNTKNSDIEALLHLTDYLFLNYTEFKNLGDWLPGTQDIAVAEKIIRLSGASLLALKRYDAISLFYQLHNRVLCWSHKNVVLSQEEIEDDTGAGDVFAGGFLAGSLTQGFSFRECVELALRMVRAKLRTPGTRGFGVFPSILARLVEDVSKDTAYPLQLPSP